MAGAHRIVRRYMDVRSGQEGNYAEWIQVFESGPVVGRTCLDSAHWRIQANDLGCASRLQHPRAVSSCRARFGAEPDVSTLGAVHRRRLFNRAACSKYSQRICRARLADQRRLSQDATAISRRHRIRRSRSRRASGSPCSITTMHCIQWRCISSPRQSPRNPRCFADLLRRRQDRSDDNARYDPYFKCDYNYELLLAHNMISHLVRLSPKLDRRARWFPKGIRRLTGLRSCAARHRENSAAIKCSICRVFLYHWRAHRGEHCGERRSQAVCGTKLHAGRSPSICSGVASAARWCRRLRRRR